MFRKGSASDVGPMESGIARLRLAMYVLRNACGRRC